MIGGYQAHVQTGHRDKNGTQDQTPQGPPEHFGEQPYWRLHFSPRGLLAALEWLGFLHQHQFLTQIQHDQVPAPPIEN
jgi:hypothetical protein